MLRHWARLGEPTLVALVRRYFLGLSLRPQLFIHPRLLHPGAVFFVEGGVLRGDIAVGCDRIALTSFVSPVKGVLRAGIVSYEYCS